MNLNTAALYYLYHIYTVHTYLCCCIVQSKTLTIIYATFIKHNLAWVFGYCCDTYLPHTEPLYTLVGVGIAHCSL